MVKNKLPLPYNGGRPDIYPKLGARVLMLNDKKYPGAFKWQSYSIVVGHGEKNEPIQIAVYNKEGEEYKHGDTPFHPLVEYGECEILGLYDDEYLYYQAYKEIDAQYPTLSDEEIAQLKGNCKIVKQENPKVKKAIVEIILASSVVIMGVIGLFYNDGLIYTSIAALAMFVSGLAIVRGMV